jgi:hypothetical protein
MIVHFLLPLSAVSVFEKEMIHLHQLSRQAIQFYSLLCFFEQSGAVPLECSTSKLLFSRTAGSSVVPQSNIMLSNDSNAA